MFLTPDQIKQIGFKSIGENNLISDKAVFYNAANLKIGDNCRIDDFCIITAPMKIGNRVHIACGVYIIGQGLVIMKDYSAISSHSAIYSSTDSYDGELMTNPCIPEMVLDKQLRKTIHKPVYIGKHVVIGTGSTVLLGSILFAGCAVYAHSLVNGEFDQLSIIAGVPAKVIKQRKSNIFELEKYLE